MFFVVVGRCALCGWWVVGGGWLVGWLVGRLVGWLVPGWVGGASRINSWPTLVHASKVRRRPLWSKHPKTTGGQCSGGMGAGVTGKFKPTKNGRPFPIRHLSIRLEYLSLFSLCPCFLLSYVTLSLSFACALFLFVSFLFLCLTWSVSLSVPFYFFFL